MKTDTDRSSVPTELGTAIEINLKEWFEEEELTKEDLELLAYLKTIGLQDYLDVWKIWQ